VADSGATDSRGDSRPGCPTGKARQVFRQQRLILPAFFAGGWGFGSPLPGRGRPGLHWRN